MKKLRIQAVAWAGFLLMALPASPPSAAATMQEKATSKQPVKEQKEEKQVRGARDMADGQIKTVTCKGRAMVMIFDDSDEILHLRTDNYFKVNFSAINFTPSGTMNPCKTVQGMYARVHYYHIKGHPKEGELISVELRK
ncbi:MAG TPA: hypothetical protein VFL79_01115 [Terriglobia bacterium]|nr:hypothetical protein [Terriglobia bacterium]